MAKKTGLKTDKIEELSIVAAANVEEIDPSLAPMFVGLSDEKALTVSSTFKEFFDIAREWDAKARTIVVTDISQKEEMKQAGEVRKLLKKKRGEVEARRKELKEQIIIEGKAIDGCANLLKGLFEPAEKYLEEQETFADRYEAEQNKLRAETRLAELSPFDSMAAQYDLVNMSEENYARVLLAGKEAKRLKDEQDAENERLKAQAAAAEQQLKDLQAMQAKAQEEQERARIASISFTRMKELMAAGFGIVGDYFAVAQLRRSAENGTAHNLSLRSEMLGKMTDEAWKVFMDSAIITVADNAAFREEVKQAVATGLSPLPKQEAPVAPPPVAENVIPAGFKPVYQAENLVVPVFVTPGLDQAQRNENASLATGILEDQKYFSHIINDLQAIQTGRMLLTVIHTERGQKINSAVNELLSKVRVYIDAQIKNWP